MGKYDRLTLPVLRQELEKRGAKRSGRKKELIERLEAYDRNSNFGCTTSDLNHDDDWRMFIRFMRFCKKDETTFLRTQCRAKMRRTTTYDMDLSLDKHGNILETQYSGATRWNVGNLDYACKVASKRELQLADVVTHS
ncbi:hypothetical protein LSAT2_020364 [Lamellibrachia satsuma]|nr:hypothetical protein LSAT2_020364 [Lamellibrachia satsuma]